jgi:hypothetical protein
VANELLDHAPGHGRSEQSVTRADGADARDELFGRCVLEQEAARAVGMTRRQARRMIRNESVVTALIGAALGLPLGIMLAAAVTHALGRYGVTFRCRWPRS